MTRTCARPGCGDHAVATLTYAYGERAVWLSRLADEGHPMAHDLCESHAGALVVPQGWSVRDERHPAGVGEWPAPFERGAIPA